MAVDPVSIREFYIAYHDRESSGSTRIRVLVTPVIWMGDHWQFDQAIVVPDPIAPPSPPPGQPEDDHADQFLPAITVDSQANVHLTYYNDRRFWQPDSTPEAKWDIERAESTDGGQTYSTTLYAAPPPNGSWHDQTIDPPPAPFPLEYNGAAYLDRGGGEIEVWMSCMGSNVENLPNKSEVIWVFSMDE